VNEVVVKWEDHEGHPRRDSWAAAPPATVRTVSPGLLRARGVGSPAACEHVGRWCRWGL